MKICTILVTHDLREISKLSDKVFMIRDGKIAAQGAPADVFGVSATHACRTARVEAKRDFLNRF